MQVEEVCGCLVLSLIFFFKDVGEGGGTEPEVSLTMSTE